MSLSSRWKKFLTNRLRIWLGVLSIEETEFRIIKRMAQNREEGEEWNAKMEQKRHELEAFANKLRMQSLDIERRYKELSQATMQMEGVASAMTLAISDSSVEVQKYVRAIKDLSVTEEGDIK